MKKTHLYTLIVGFFYFSLAGQAQKPTWGFFAGPQRTSAMYKIDDIKQPTDYKTAMQLGITTKARIENNLFFGPAVYYSLKGYKVTLNQSSFPPDPSATNNSTTLHTLEIAPLIQYDFSSLPAHFFVKFGPAIDIALYGKEEFDTRDRQHISRAMKFSYADYGLFTAQGIIHFGYETANGLFVFAHYAQGLGSLNNADHGPKIKHRIAGLSLGWYLHKTSNWEKKR